MISKGRRLKVIPALQRLPNVERPEGNHGYGTHLSLKSRNKQDKKSRKKLNNLGWGLDKIHWLWFCATQMLRQNCYSWWLVSRSAFSPPSWLTNPSPSTIDFGLWLFQSKPFVFLFPSLVIKSIICKILTIPLGKASQLNVQWSREGNECPQMNLGPTVLVWFSNIFTLIIGLSHPRNPTFPSGVPESLQDPKYDTNFFSKRLFREPYIEILSINTFK